MSQNLLAVTHVFPIINVREETVLHCAASLHNAEHFAEAGRHRARDADAFLDLRLLRPLRGAEIGRAHV